MELVILKVYALTVSNVKGAQNLIECGFDYVCDIEGEKLLGKSKCKGTSENAKESGVPSIVAPSPAIPPFFLESRRHLILRGNVFKISIFESIY
jgi:hypothetical protein